MKECCSAAASCGTSLYDTTSGGGDSNSDAGTVFKVDSSGTKRSSTTGSGREGWGPYAGLITATAFELTTDGTGKMVYSLDPSRRIRLSALRRP